MTRLLSLILLLSACQSRPRIIEPSLEDVMMSDMEWMRKHFGDPELTKKLNK